MPNPDDHLDTLIDKIESGNREIVHECDRELILELDDQLRLLRDEYGAHRRLMSIPDGQATCSGR